MGGLGLGSCCWPFGIPLENCRLRPSFLLKVFLVGATWDGAPHKNLGAYSSTQYRGTTEGCTVWLQEVEEVVSGLLLRCAILKEELIVVLGIQIRKNETRSIRPSLVTRSEDVLYRSLTKSCI